MLAHQDWKRQKCGSGLAIATAYGRHPRRPWNSLRPDPDGVRPGRRSFVLRRGEVCILDPLAGGRAALNPSLIPRRGCNHGLTSAPWTWGPRATVSSIFDQAGRIRGLAQKEHRTDLPAIPAGSNTTPWRYGRTTRQVIRGMPWKPPAGSRRRDLAAIGVTNQRETAVVWDQAVRAALLQRRSSGSDMRTDDICKRNGSRNGGQDRFRETDGPAALPPIFPGPKSGGSWKTCPRPKAGADRGEALFGTIETWLIWWLTGGPHGRGPCHRRHQRQPDHAHEPGNPASGTTSILEIHGRAGIGMLPRIVSFHRLRRPGNQPLTRRSLRRPGARSAAPWATSRPPWSGRPALSHG